VASGQKHPVILSEAVPKSKDPYIAHNRCGGGTFWAFHPYLNPEDAMRAYLARLTPTARMLLTIPVVAIAYVLVTMVGPAVIRAAVPDVVRSVLGMM
jgi:hypothetical protein